MKTLAITLVIAALILLVGTICPGDVIYLNTGGKVEGRVVKNDPDDGVWVKTVNGTVEIAAEDIERIEECESVFDIYERKLKEIPKDKAESRYKLALWCKEKGLKAKARKHFKEVIALSPDQEKARAELGYVKTKNGWEIPPKEKKASGNAEKDKKPATPVAKKNAKSEKPEGEKSKKKKKTRRKKPSKPAKPLVKTIRASCNVYILWCSKTKEAALIDCGGGANEVSQYLQQNKLKLTKIIITHAHGDHTAAIPSVTGQYKVEVIAHEKAPRFRGVTKTVKEGDTIKVGTLTLKVIFTPGHSPGSMCLYLDSGKMLFSGDTLFNDAIGRTRDRRALIQVIKEKLMGLGNDVVVYPGHGARTTIGAEKRNFGGGR